RLSCSTAILAVVRQKLHLSSCPSLSGQLYSTMLGNWPQRREISYRPRSGYNPNRCRQVCFSRPAIVKSAPARRDPLFQRRGIGILAGLRLLAEILVLSVFRGCDERQSAAPAALRRGRPGAVFVRRAGRA